MGQPVAVSVLVALAMVAFVLAIGSAARGDPIAEATERLTASTDAGVDVSDADAGVADADAGRSGADAGRPTPIPPARPPLDVALAGGVSISMAFIDWGRPTASGARDGDLRFDVLRVGVRARYDRLSLDAEYRIYPHYQFLRRAIIAYRLDFATFDVGVSRAPFGLLPFASNSWFFGLPYYLGLEDDADFGVRARFMYEGLDVWLAFYKNGEGSFTGRSLDSARFSYDVVRATAAELAGSGITADRNDRETNELVARVAYGLTRDVRSFELGASARVGSLHDVSTGARSPHWASALHLRASYGPVQLALEWASYGFSPHVSPGDDARLVVMGGFDAPYAVARRGHVLVANLSCAFDVAWGPIELVRVYFDSGRLWKTVGNFPSSTQLVLGLYFLLGPMHLSMDAAFGRHHPWVGPDYGPAFGQGAANDRWYRWIHVNTGFSY